MPLRKLSASTLIRLHPEFFKHPDLFAKRHGVDFVDDVFPASSFKDNKETGEKDESLKANIHLVHHKAIRLFTEPDSDGDWWIKGYDLRPSMLLYGTKDHPMTGDDLAASLSKLRNEVAPLLADPEDARYIVPGLVDDGNHVSSWSEIESEIWIPDVDLRCLHGVSHPATGPAEGSTKQRLKLGKRGDCVILIKTAKWTIASPEGWREVHGVSVRLTLHGSALVNSFRNVGSSSRIGNVMRLVSFRATGVANVHQETMSQLEGNYLPVPPEWISMGKPMTTAKVVALLSELTSIPSEELRAMYEARSAPSPKTHRRLFEDGVAAEGFLKKIPVSSLFRPEVYADRLNDQRRPLTTNIDPQIAAAYGSDVSSL